MRLKVASSTSASSRMSPGSKMPALVTRPCTPPSSLAVRSTALLHVVLAADVGRQRERARAAAAQRARDLGCERLVAIDDRDRRALAGEAARPPPVRSRSHHRSRSPRVRRVRSCARVSSVAAANSIERAHRGEQPRASRRRPGARRRCGGSAASVADQISTPSGASLPAASSPRRKPTRSSSPSPGIEPLRHGRRHVVRFGRADARASR